MNKAISTSPNIFSKCYEYKEAENARKAGLYPFFRPIERSEGTKVIIEGREFLMAGSNNYLGLAQDRRVEEAAQEAVRKYGASCSGSRFMNGTLKIHEELEEHVAEFVNQEEALCFTTGYQTNLGAISALVGKNDHIFSDKFNHASIVDGIFMATGINRSVHTHRYKHNNMDDLEEKLKSVPLEASKLIVTDGVFSMEGDIVNLPKLNDLARTYNAGVYLDEAHALGVVGKTGRGTLEYHEIHESEDVDLIMCTFSKSLASIGGFVAGKREVVDYIKHFARPLIFSASMSPANLGAVMKSLEILESEPERVERLHAIAEKMIRSCNDLGFDTGTTETPIVPLITGDFERTFLFWKALFDRGLYVNPVIPPAVPPNRCLLRTSYMAIHTDEELDQIINILGEEGRKFGIIDP